MKVSKTVKNKLSKLIDNIKYISNREINAYRPIVRLSPVEWCQKNMVLDKKTTNYPGKYNPNLTPFVIPIMNISENQAVEEIVLMFASQVSKTVMMVGLALQSLAQNEGSHLWVMDSSDKAIKMISKQRFKPTLDSCQILKESLILDGGKESLKHYNFTRATISFVGANSPGQLASDSIKRIFADEIDKYPAEFTSEAGAVQLLRSRTKAFKFDKKMFWACTPTTEEGNIYLEFTSTTHQYYYFVPCPNCLEFQLLEDNQLKTLKELEYSPETEDEILKQTYYECKHCNKVIRERHKPEMLRNGEWRTKDGEELKPNRKIAFQLSSLYSPFVSFGAYNLERLKCKDNPILLRDFANSWQGLPYKERSLSVDKEGLEGRLSLHKKGIVPKQARIVVGSIDCQKDHYYCQRIAFGYKYKAWVIDWCKVQTLKEADDYFRCEMLSNDGQKIYKTKKVAIDAGYEPADVYLWCLLNQENTDLYIPVLGARTKMQKNFTAGQILYDMPSFNRKIRVYRATVNTNVYKEMIYDRLNRKPNSNGSFNLYRNPEKDLCKQLTAEEKQEKRVKGKPSVWEWFVKGENHLLDCAVYSFFLAEYLGIYRWNVNPDYDNHNNENMFQDEDNKSPFIEKIKDIMQEKEEIKPVKERKRIQASNRFKRL